MRKHYIVFEGKEHLAERVKRLPVPFLFGTILLMPIPFWLVLSLGLPLPLLSECLSIGGKSLAEYTYVFLVVYFVFSNDKIIDNAEKNKWLLYKNTFFMFGYRDKTAQYEVKENRKFGFVHRQEISKTFFVSMSIKYYFRIVTHNEFPVSL